MRFKCVQLRRELNKTYNNYFSIHIRPLRGLPNKKSFFDLSHSASGGDRGVTHPTHPRSRIPFQGTLLQFFRKSVPCIALLCFIKSSHLFCYFCSTPRFNRGHTFYSLFIIFILTPSESNIYKKNAIQMCSTPYGVE